MFSVICVVFLDLVVSFKLVERILWCAPFSLGLVLEPQINVLQRKQNLVDKFERLLTWF